MIPQISRMTPTGIGLKNRWYQESRDAGAQDQEQKITEHGMVYFKQDGETRVKEEPVDFPKAKSEIESLGYGEYNHYIGFINQKTGELLQFARDGPNEWYAEVPIVQGGSWTRYVWGCRTNTASVVSVSKLFFEELPWFDMLPFMMRKIPPELIR